MTTPTHILPVQQIEMVRSHNRPAAAVWCAGGAAYDDISFAISDALGHAAQRLNAREGHEVLDVATGTGWSARNAARKGARVSAVDIAPELLRAAAEFSAHVKPAIDFRIADAEELPFADGRFDRVISTFGVMFAGDHADAARELARVCRPGARLCLTTWATDGAVAYFFRLLASHGDAPAGAVSPLSWGDPDYIRKLLERDFALTFEPGFSNAYHDGPEDIWDWYLRGFGPLRTLYQGLDEKRRRALRKDVDAYHEHYRVEAGLHVRREYLLTIGTRR